MGDPMLDLARNVAKFTKDTNTRDANVVRFCIAKVIGYSGGKIQIQRPFDSTILSLPYVSSAGSMSAGTSCFVLIPGSMSLAIVLGDAKLQNL